MSLENSYKKIGYNILILGNVSVDDLVKATGFPKEVVVAGVKKIKREVGGIKGSAQKGYSLVEDAEARLKLSQSTNL